MYIDICLNEESELNFIITGHFKSYHVVLLKINNFYFGNMTVNADVLRIKPCFLLDTATILLQWYKAIHDLTAS